MRVRIFGNIKGNASDGYVVLFRTDTRNVPQGALYPAANLSRLGDKSKCKYTADAAHLHDDDAPRFYDLEQAVAYRKRVIGEFLTNMEATGEFLSVGTYDEDVPDGWNNACESLSAPDDLDD